jgi:hypothetical protein
MCYSEQLQWEDQSKILYSNYYRALSHKQHAMGTQSQKDFLTDIINLAQEMCVILNSRKSEFMEILLTADSLSAAPYGIGGRRVLEEIYQYDKNAVTLNIARELQLSDFMIECLDRNTFVGKGLEISILQAVPDTLENVDVLTPEIRQVFLEAAKAGFLADEQRDRLRNQPITPEQEEIIKRQEACIRHAISKPLPRHYDNPLEYWLGTKEWHFAQFLGQPKLEVKLMRFADIDWRVLDIKDGKALLLSEMVVAYYHYHPTECEITWAECDLRRYLNGHFYNSLEEEKSRIAETVVVNDDNRWYGTKGGADTNDKLFLLSIEEADRYFGDSGDYLGKKRTYTSIFRDIHNREYLSEDGEKLSNDYNADRRAFREKGFYSPKNGDADPAWWWLRTPGAFGYKVAGVDVDGSIFVDGSYVHYRAGIRPALWLNL